VTQHKKQQEEEFISRVSNLLTISSAVVGGGKVALLWRRLFSGCRPHRSSAPRNIALLVTSRCGEKQSMFLFCSPFAKRQINLLRGEMPLLAFLLPAQ
jgi:hypothetical protein